MRERREEGRREEKRKWRDRDGKRDEMIGPS